jgi:ketosteroid isomerase-like protein
MEASAQTPASPSVTNTEREIRTLEEQERAALLRGDVTALERLWGRDLVISAPSNTIRTGAEMLELIKNDSRKYGSFERQIERVSVQGDVAITMGAESVVPSSGEAGRTVRRRFTNVWARQNGQWRLIARQSTIVDQAS